MNVSENHIWITFLIIIVFTTFFMNFMAATSAPIIFGDEGYYASKGLWMLENLKIPSYANFYGGDQLFYNVDLDVHYVIFLVSSFFAIGGEFLVKMLDPILATLTGLMTFLFAKKIYNGKVGILSVFFFLILPSVTTYAVFLYTDMFATLFIISSIYFLFKGLKDDSNKYIIISGIFAGFAALNKETGFLLVLIYLLAFFFYRKDWLKRFGLILLLTLVVASPLYLFHNFLLFGNPGLPVIDSYFPSPDWQSSKIPIIEREKLELHTTGTYAGIFQYGILNYIQFSYGLGAFVFIILGLSYLLYRKNKEDIILLIWIIFLFFFVAYYTGGEGKVEALSRWLLPLMPLFAVSAGLVTEKIYRFLKSQGGNAGKITGIMFIFIILIFGLVSANAKSTDLQKIKTWSPAFVKGCDWIRRNTPENSDIASIWVYHGMYHCKRNIYWAYLPNRETIVLSANDTSYNLLKKDGIDYIYFQKFSISFDKDAESYPVEFVNYVKNSDKFEKVYEYPENCLFSSGNDCVLVYKIL